MLLKLLCHLARIIAILCLPLPLIMIFDHVSPDNAYDQPSRIVIGLLLVLLCGMSVGLVINNGFIIRIIRRYACEVNMRTLIISCIYFDFTVLLVSAFELLVFFSYVLST